MLRGFKLGLKALFLKGLERSAVKVVRSVLRGADLGNKVSLLDKPLFC